MPIRNEFEREAWKRLMKVLDPEIPVNIVDLGLVYNCTVSEKDGRRREMTLTAPNCPMADQVKADAERAIAAIDGIDEVAVRIVWDPPWDRSMMSDAARLELGMLYRRVLLSANSRPDTFRAEDNTMNHRSGKAYVLLIVVGLIVVALGAWFLIMVVRSNKSARETMGVNNLSQLWKFANLYRYQDPPPATPFPKWTGPEFWSSLTSTKPPLIGPALARDIFSCPVLRGGEATKGCDYRGPVRNPDELKDEDAVGADRTGNHSDGGAVLFKNGAVVLMPASDPRWKAADRTTTAKRK
ncbi:MAG: metal-sulfur cluster assembly factor [Planctomycetota bacterium]